MQSKFKLFMLTLLAAAAFATAGLCQTEQVRKPELTVFYSNHCKICMMINKEFLPKLRQRYADRIIWKELETGDNGDNLALLYIIFEEHKKDSPSVPSILVDNRVLLVGKTNIEQNLEKEIEAALAAARTDAATPQVPPDQPASPVLKHFFAKMSVTAVIGAGLIDGINPCAFAVIVFFVSFLAVYGYNRRDIIYVGTAYCAAVFLTYLLLGLGLFKALYALSGFYLAMKIFYYLTAGFCFLLACFSLYDWLLYTRTGRSDGMLLQLPKNFKVYVNRITGALMRGREDRSPLRMTLAAFTVGLAVSLIEAVCTGQVYVPTIVFIMKDPALRAQAIWYLLLYNFMFIVPLVAVFLLSFAGFESDKFNTFLKTHLGLAKILLTLVFLSLALLLLFNT